MQLDEIQAIFFQECEEGLATIETNLATARDHAPDPETINTIFRAVHSIKGGAGAFGLDALQAFAHHLETVLDLLRTGELAPDAERVTLLFAGFDVLTDHVASAQGTQETPDDRAVLAQLEAAAAGASNADGDVQADVPPAPLAPEGPANDVLDFDLDSLLAAIDLPEPEGPPWTLHVYPGLHAFDNGGDPLPLLREIEALGGAVVALDIEALPPLDSLVVDECRIGWTIRVPGKVSRADIDAVFDFVADSYRVAVSRSADDKAAYGDATPDRPATPLPAAAASRAVPPEPTGTAAGIVAATSPLAPAPVVEEGGKAAPGSTTIRVELDKLDRLVNLVGELVITQAMLAQQLTLRGVGAVDELADLDHLTRELQESAMSIRAQPVKSVFSRVPRIIRELEASTGKRVRLEVEGEMTEVDKTVVERIGEPLTHMIRNAVDHGLETPDERALAGKAPEGVVRLAAEHRSGRIVISVSDDGRGIDRRRVRNKAVERGIIAADAHLSEEDTDNLIFAPGFSTAATVSNISGRGVGMDVVRRNVQALGGRIGIASRFGHGSTFTLSLPLTLAVLDGMVVSVGAQTYVIPLAHVVESLRPGADDVRGMGPGTGLLNVRGAYLPILPVGRLLGVADARTEPTQAVLVVVETDAGQSILMVDAIQDQRQVVVKSLEANYAAVSGLSGATILGDGRVALILDVETLVRRNRADLAPALAA